MQPAARPAGQAGQGRACATPGGFPIEFVTIAVSDGISMGHEGMRASLVSREVIADSVETVMHAERFDALVTFAGCDKSLPGMLMAAARLNLPAVFLYGGIDPARPPQRPGARHRQRVRGGRRPRRRHDRPTTSFDAIERNACPTEGSCAGMFTANTMASVAEALGMSLPGSSSAARGRPPPRRLRLRSRARRWSRLLEQGIRPRADHDQGGVRERHRRHHGARRLHQRRAPPAGHRRRGPGRARARRLQPGRPRGCRTSPTPSRTASTT